jgi:uncharacterized protein DUF4260
MKNLVKLEELFLGILSFYLFLTLHIRWWWFFVLLLTPDLSMIGYLFNPRVGAILYNVVHHRMTSVLLFLLGGMLQSQWMQAAALILFGHSSLDRVFGYGLKYLDSFEHTHLGTIGQVADARSRSADLP